MRSIVLAVVLAACGGEPSGPSAEALHKQLAPVIEPKLVVIEKILAAAFPEPTGKLTLDGGPPLVMARGSSPNNVTGNALYAFEADLRSIDRYQRNPLRYNFNGEIVNDCFMLARKKMFAGGHFDTYSRDSMSWKGDDHVVGMKLPLCGPLRYLIVIKIDAFKETEYISKEKFGGGGAAAQVHIFDLEAGGKHLGGVTFTAVSSELISGDMSQDLRENFYKALKKAVGEQLPDANLGS